MPALKNLSGNQRIPLAQETLVGRSPNSLLVLTDRRVSLQHAVLKWDGTCWCVRDLGSRNGTRLGEHPLSTSEWAKLLDGQVVHFGSPDQAWVLESAGQPEPLAQDPETGALFQGDMGSLELPGNALVATDDGQDYWLLQGDARQKVLDGSVVELNGHRYRLFLPIRQARARTLTIESPVLPRDLTLEFFVSQDQEHVEVRLVADGLDHRFRPHAEDALLLELARARLDDADANQAEVGWRYCDELQKKLGIARHHLNIQVYRIRERFSAVGVLEPNVLVERRVGNHSLRLNVRDVRVVGGAQ